MKKILLILGAILLTAAGAQGAVTCSVAASLVFGSFNPLPGQSANTTGTISVTCMGTVGDSASYTITITPGLGSFLARRMFSGVHNLTYNLYTDSGYTQVWGDGTASTYSVADSITLISASNTKNYVVYGRIAGGQNTDPAGTYSDSLLVNLNY